jgi:hypothetical protein
VDDRGAGLVDDADGHDELDAVGDRVEVRRIQAGLRPQRGRRLLQVYLDNLRFFEGARDPKSVC